MLSSFQNRGWIKQASKLQCSFAGIKTPRNNSEENAQVKAYDEIRDWESWERSSNLKSCWMKIRFFCVTKESQNVAKCEQQIRIMDWLFLPHYAHQWLYYEKIQPLHNRSCCHIMSVQCMYIEHQSFYAQPAAYPSCISTWAMRESFETQKLLNENLIL